MLDNQYFKKFLADKEINLKEHIQIDKLCTLELDPKAFEDFAETHRSEATVKWYHPRPFLNAETNQQAINANWIGYNEHNTTETNWGLDPKHNQLLKEIIGRDNFDRMGIDPDETLLRLLEYMPGHCLPLHYDGFEGFKRLYGRDEGTRFFVAVSDWDWGHVLQVHDNMISNWRPGDTYIIPAGVCHASANFGIGPKYTLTVTGVRR
jgi:mannose-6-phosphate isomerase-like protein (cupin superfamily)